MNVTVDPQVRLPANYRLVLDVVRELGSGRHLATMDIFIEAKRRRPAIGYSTVYRGLARLCELGLVAEIIVPGSCAAYETASAHHAHFRCDGCGLLSDVDYAIPPETVARIAQASGIEITGEALTFRGLCARCRTTLPCSAALRAGTSPAGGDLP